MHLHTREIENNCSPSQHLITHNTLRLWEDQTNDPSLDPVEGGFLTDEQFEKWTLFLGGIVQLSNMAAFVSNSLNIAVFVKLGFSEPSNISLIALAVADLSCVMLSFWAIMSVLINFVDFILPFHATNLSHVTVGGMFSFGSRTIAWITAFISFERCLCILVPLKVKSIITPRSTLTAIIIIVTLTFCPYFTAYLRYKFVWVFYPSLNATILDIVPIDYFASLEKIITVICGVIHPLLAFSIVLICTVFLVVQLRKISSWRKSVTSAIGRMGDNSGGNPSSPAAKNRLSHKEERLVGMVVVIATTFIVSNTPTCVMLLCYIVFDEFSIFGVYRRLYLVLTFLTILGQSISASVNILIYYNMTHKFRLCLHRLLRLDRQEQVR
ncbi:chemosensory receptor a [Plakobranchus ocellatus]|uniref:Chemosensory receptor a n=1 Tax=Plakobranchus ocellatus TaxID=259542 RepID=A0AAV3YSI7_9GAST|nr:chemosensory receptor a [Plakobranchus ocellatus]